MSLKEVADLKRKVNALKKFTPSQVLPPERERDLLDVCEAYEQKWKSSGNYRKVLDDNNKFLSESCSCVSTSSTLPQLLNKQCRSRGLKPMGLHSNKLVVCNASKDLTGASSVIEQGNTQIACNFAGAGDIDPDAFVYAADSTNFYLSPSWLFTIAIIVIMVSLLSMAYPGLRMNLTRLISKF